MLKFLKKVYVLLLKKMDLGSAVAVRLTKYTGKSDEFVHPKHFLQEKPWFVRQINKNDVVLDLGSGNGQNAIKCAKVAKKVIGVEIDETLIKIAQNTAKHERLKNVSFQRTDLEKVLNFKNKSFNKTIFLDVLEHVANRKQILSEIRRTLKPKGILLLGVPNSNTSWKRFQRSVGVCSYSDPDHKIEFSESLIRKILSESRFKIIHLEYDSYDTPFRGFYDVLGGFYLPIYKKISLWRLQKAIRNPQEASGFRIVAQK